MSWKSTESFKLSEALRIYTLVCAEAPTSGMCRSRANTNMSSTLRRHHVAFLSALSCRNCCGEFGQMCASCTVTWKMSAHKRRPGSLSGNPRGKWEDISTWLTSQLGAIWRWGEALLFFPCCCSLIVLESCSTGSSPSLYTGLSMRGGISQGPTLWSHPGMPVMMRDILLVSKFATEI